MIPQGLAALLGILLWAPPSSQLRPQEAGTEPGAPVQLPLSGLSEAQDFQEIRFRAETLLVLVDVLVLDGRAGTPVAGLTSQDLVLHEDGVAQLGYILRED